MSPDMPATEGESWSLLSRLSFGKQGTPISFFKSLNACSWYSRGVWAISLDLQTAKWDGTCLPERSPPTSQYRSERQSLWRTELILQSFVNVTILLELGYLLGKTLRNSSQEFSEGVHFLYLLLIEGYVTEVVLCHCMADQIHFYREGCNTDGWPSLHYCRQNKLKGTCCHPNGDS